MDSKEVSLEKKPDLKGKHINLKLPKQPYLYITPLLVEPLSSNRISKLPIYMCKNKPENINKVHLKKAWIKRWKNLRAGFPQPISMTIKPMCLIVDKAIIFFKFISPKVLKEDKKVVIKPKINKYILTNSLK